MAKNREGFTIIEVLISMGILVVALFALSSLQTTSVGSNAAGQQTTIATMLAQDKLEELMSLDYDDPQLSDTVTNFIDTDEDGVANYFDWSVATDHTNADGIGNVANPIDASCNNVASAGYTRTWNVVDDTPDTNLKMVSVNVTWFFKGRRSITVDTIISRR
ncbi:MAG: prepilin-type N-terminal cleavage/methylation domain-containing protein [Deltaproteobacteria bacterium]|nr:prepilin-type N-terminal cleavage/methylation domain-containing protein [Deltaproteobacteria bacterium]